MKKFFPIGAVILGWWTAAFFIFVILAFHIYASIPTSEMIKGCLTTKMHKVNLCPQSKNYTSLKSISSNVRNAIIISEDGNFYSHNGFDFEEMKESFKENLLKKTFKRGGSTITQQLAKNMFLSSEKTIIRKLKEALITIKIESTLSKNEIIERYLNLVEFGENLYGIKAASQFYFKKTPDQLSVLESSFLALLLPNPKKNSASFRKRVLTPYARQRIRQTVERMFLLGRIDFESYTLAKLNMGSFPWDGELVQNMPAAPVDDSGELTQPEIEDETPDESFTPEDEAEYSDDYI
ncbi:MAG: monofunctional biosynthetic peptidoglycan transglycosylase [Bdellovibrionales bacterium]